MNLRKFKLDLVKFQSLDEDEREMLPILEKAVEAIAEVYQIQLEEGFYPKDATKSELEEAALKNPSILSPFTHVYRNKGELKAGEYHIRYEKYLVPIANQIDRAAELSRNPSFKVYLKARAKSLRDGSYKEADIVWLNVSDNNLGFSVGPFERYLDKVFFVKRAFQAHLGIVDRQKTKLAEAFRETLYSFANLTADGHHSTNIPKKGVNILVQDTPITSGYMSDVLFSGEHFPCDLDIMQEYGSRIIVYSSQIRVKFEKLYLPIFNSLFESTFASKYPEDLLFKATVYSTILYELSRQLHKFDGARERLKELYGPIDEANRFASGIQHSKYLLMKGLLSQDEIEAMMIIHIVWMFSDWLIFQKNKGVENYVKANAIALNMYLSSGALKIQGGVSWPNFAKIFFQIENLADILVFLLQHGNYKDAQKFVSENAKLEIFENLETKLPAIELEI